MTATPRVEIDLNKIRHNASLLVEQLGEKGISVTGVTKAVCGHPGVAQAMLDGGVVAIADARVANVERMRAAGLKCPMVMIRTPICSQTERVAATCDVSFNTELKVVRSLAAAAALNANNHKITIMIEMGDQRDGVHPENLLEFASAVAAIDGVVIAGIGANFGCMGHKPPSAENMEKLCLLACDVEVICGQELETVSGGGSANLPWALAQTKKTRVNNLRLGESILLGVEPLSGNRLEGLFTDTFTLVADVIENNAGSHFVLALGDQDVDVKGIKFPADMTLVGSTSDHVIVEHSSKKLPIGAEVRMQLNYSALMRAMNAGDVAKSATF